MILPDFLTQDEHGSIRIAGHRLGLTHLLHYYNDGYSPEMLLIEYPSLSLALVHKVIAFYLENQADVDAYVSQSQDKIEQQRACAPKTPDLAELRKRMEATARAQGH